MMHTLANILFQSVSPTNSDIMVVNMNQNFYGQLRNCRVSKNIMQLKPR